MDKILEQKFWDRWPHWFNRRDSRISLMCYGFSCGDGWFDLLWKLCEEIEVSLGETPLQKRYAFLRMKWANRWNTFLYRVFDGLVAKEKRLRASFHKRFYQSTGEQIYVWHPSWAQNVQERLMVDPTHQFQVIQIKEKFGTLCFYVDMNLKKTDPRIEKIRGLIHAAENATCTLCEKCGASGAETKPWNGYHIITLCPNCAFKGGYISGLDVARDRATKNKLK